MYPLIAIITVGILRKDKGVYQYVLPLSIGGLLVAFYQILLENGFLSQGFLPCTTEVPCITKYINYFGFITIPVLSFLAFAVITGCMLIYKEAKKK